MNNLLDNEFKVSLFYAFTILCSLILIGYASKHWDRPKLKDPTRCLLAIGLSGLLWSTMGCFLNIFNAGQFVSVQIEGLFGRVRLVIGGTAVGLFLSMAITGQLKTLFKAKRKASDDANING